MKHLFYLSPLLLICCNLNGQSIALKLYGGLRSEATYRLYGDNFGFAPQLPDNKKINIRSDVDQSLFAMPALAFELKNGDFGEIGFASKSSSSIVEGFYQTDTSSLPRTSKTIIYGSTQIKGFDVQLEYNFRLNNNGSNWRPSLGASLNLSNSSLVFTPELGSIYMRERTSRGASIGFVPRIQYQVLDRFFFDFSATFFVFTMDLEHSADRNPLLTSGQQENDLVNTRLFSRYWLRIGAGWEIPLKKKK